MIFGLDGLPLHYVGLLLVGVAVVGWLLSGRGPRSRRAHRRAQRLLRQGAWREAQALVQQHQAQGALTPAWQSRWCQVEAACHQAAAEAALQARAYEVSLEHFLQAARLLQRDEAEARTRVLQAMLDDVYRLFAANAPADASAAEQLLARTPAIQTSCPEASFWLGLCHVRQGRLGQALVALQESATGPKEVETDKRAEQASDGERRPSPSAARFLDPPLYLGALLLGEGRTQEALRYLSDANRLAPGCPLILWQLGLALVAANGDSLLATRALGRAVGPEGLPRWLKTGPLLWVEGLPEGRSYVRRLATKYPFSCPVFGNNVAVLVRQGHFALGQAQYRLGNFQEAANLFATVLQESPPTAAVLRWLGQSLARLENYEDAYKHLRIAYDQEEPKRPLTAGYLALCGARGRPSQPEDRHKNVAWALQLLAQFDVPGDVEWAGLCNAVHAEARELGMPLTAEEQVRLCDLLTAVNATDATAGAAYAHLAATFPEALRAEHTWLYCRAAQVHGLRSPNELDLFGQLFHQAAAARAFYEQRQWDFDEVEYTGLARHAALQPGHFPEALGADYPARGEELLLERSRRQEQAGRSEEALASAEVLLQLAPQSPRAHDRLAYLHYQQSQLEQAAALLQAWQRLEPDNYWPAVRRAIVEQQQGHFAGCAEAVDQALARTRGAVRAQVAFLGARLALASQQRDQATSWLGACLQEDPEHPDALWCLAAIRAVGGDRAGLAAQAPAMERRDVTDARFQYLRAVCHWAAGNYPLMLEAGRRAAADTALVVESAYLTGWAQLQSGAAQGAAAALEQVAQAEHSPSADHARALLGRLQFQQGAYEEAIRWWSTTGADQRAAWKLDDALRQTVFLSALRALQSGQFEQAAERFREAGRLGVRDGRLGSLLIQALVQAGQKHLQSGSGPSAITLFDQALKAGCRDPQVAYLLGLAYKRQGNLREARTAWRKIAEPDANVFLQLGLLSLREHQLAQAEQEFAQAWQRDPQSYAACHNLLLTRLNLGQLEAAAVLLPQARALAPQAVDQQLWTALHALVGACQTSNGDQRVDAALVAIDAALEQRLLQLLRHLGHLDTVCRLLHALAAARPSSAAVRQADGEAVLVKAKILLDRSDWAGARRVLLPLAADQAGPGTHRATLLNLLGCCACLCQDFEEGEQYFQDALRLAGNDARLHQNLALAKELQGQLGQAELSWNRYFDLLDERIVPPPGETGYLERLAFEGLTRLSGHCADKQRWSSALTFAERALHLRPSDADTLERLFHLYQQVSRPEEARRVLRQLRQLRPGEPMVDLYEIDLIQVRTLDDMERLLAQIDGLFKRYPQDARVEDRASALVGNLIPLLGRLCDQLTEQLTKIMHQVRHLPSYQINWTTVREVLRDLRSEFQKLRRILGKCLPLIKDEEQRRILRALREVIDGKIETCQSVGE